MKIGSEHSDKKGGVWHYVSFRRGLTHIAVVLSSFTAINTFYLVSRNWLFFADLGYFEVMGIGALILVPMVWLLGFFDYGSGKKKKPSEGVGKTPFSVEAELAVERNPYSYFKFTVKEREYIYPVNVNTAKAMLALAKEFNLKGDAISDLERSVSLLEKMMQEDREN